MGICMRKENILQPAFRFNTQFNGLDYPHKSKCKCIENATLEKTFEIYNTLNNDETHHNTTDDICTPMQCVKTMIDYIPKKFWKEKEIKILDPCCGNGNFGAYCKFKTNPDNIWYNDLNAQRIANCKKLLNPKNITRQDALSLDSLDKWDLIMANPPYSGGGNKNQSLSNLFIEKSIDLLKKGGYLCFITPNNWMTYNNNNTTLKKLLNEGSFVVIDNDNKKYFPKIGSSFSVFVWQKGVFNNKTKVINSYLIKDEQCVTIPKTLLFIPLYLSSNVISIVKKLIQNENNKFNYRCDLHNFTQKDKLSDSKSKEYSYETIHTARKTRYAKIKQDIYDKWTIIVPLSTYYIPYIKTKVNVTQSVGYISFDNKNEAKKYLSVITQPQFKLLVHLTRYGNFNNIMVLKHLAFEKTINFNDDENLEIKKLIKNIKY